jgi:hypothetical protein
MGFMAMETVGRSKQMRKGKAGIGFLSLLLFIFILGKDVAQRPVGGACHMWPGRVGRVGGGKGKRDPPASDGVVSVSFLRLAFAVDLP